MIIYRATRNADGKAYIGQTVDPLPVRIARHMSYGDGPFARALRKYGIEAFTIAVVDRAASRNELDQKEREWIARTNCLAPHGFNLTEGGGGTSGWTASAETRARVRAAKVGKPRPEAVKRRLREAATGRKHTMASRAKMSAYRSDLVYMTTGTRTIRVHRRVPLPTGWRYGRHSGQRQAATA